MAPPTPSSRTETTRLPLRRAALTGPATRVRASPRSRVPRWRRSRRRSRAVVEALVGRLDARAQRRARGEIAQRRRQAAVEPRRAHAAGELAQFLDRLRELGDGGIERLCVRAGRGRAAPGRGGAQADRHQPLLRAVVEVALQPPPLLVADGDDARSRRLHLGQLPAHLDAQARDLDRQAGRARSRCPAGPAARRAQGRGRPWQAASCPGAPACERAHRPPGAATTGPTRRRACRAGSQKSSSRLGIAQRPRQHGAGRLGRCLPARAGLRGSARQCAGPRSGRGRSAGRPAAACATRNGPNSDCDHGASPPPSGSVEPEPIATPSASETAAKAAARPVLSPA